MGKGYNNFMSKKAFHPGSFANQKKIREAEARAELKRKQDEENLEQYRKEQEIWQQKSMISNQDKDKLSLSFMYEVPKELKTKSEEVEWTSQRTTAASASKPEICLQWKRERPKKIENNTSEIKKS